ncbi:MAG: HaeIII family restriction endonuclease [Acutalibacteraceae bacterium]
MEIACDEGWSLTMRIHNASSKIEPSLKFDVQLASFPSSIHAQVEPW